MPTAKGAFGDARMAAGWVPPTLRRTRVAASGSTCTARRGHSIKGTVSAAWGGMQAREKLTELQRELDRGVRVPVENWTVGEYLDHWLSDVVKPSRAPKTHQGYDLVVRRHITPRIGRKKRLS